MDLLAGSPENLGFLVGKMLKTTRVQELSLQKTWKMRPFPYRMMMTMTRGKDWDLWKAA